MPELPPPAGALLFGLRSAGSGPLPLVPRVSHMPEHGVFDSDLLALAWCLPEQHEPGYPSAPGRRFVHRTAPLIRRDGDLIQAHLGLVYQTGSHDRAEFFALISSAGPTEICYTGVDLSVGVRTVNEALSDQDAQFADPAQGPAAGPMRLSRHRFVAHVRQLLRD